MLPYVHAGHWAVNLIYFAPVVVSIAATVVPSWRDKRAADADEHGGP